MHPVMLDAAGYILLLSSLITFVMLLREGCRRKKRSPFYILSTSDVLSSIITAIALLASHMEAGITLSYNWQNNTGDIEADGAWTIKDQDRYKQDLFPRTRELNREATRRVGSNTTLTCDVKDVFTQYGMLLAPLTNAFISLLTFAVQCNLHVACAKRKCAKMMKSSSSDERLETKRVEVAEDQQELASQGSNVSARNAGITRRIMRVCQFRPARGADDQKPASFLVTSHWLVPILVTVILCLAEYDDMNTVRSMEDTECTFDSNFPLSFHVLPDAEGNRTIANSNVYTANLKNYYFVVDEASNTSSVEVNRIVSKVQGIVSNMLNFTRNFTEDTDFLDTFRLRNVTDYAKNTSFFENVANIDRTGETQTINDTIVERAQSVYNLSPYTDNSTYFNEESLFHDLPKEESSEKSDMTTLDSSSNVTQLSGQNENGSYEVHTQTHFADTEKVTTQKTADVPVAQDAAFVSEAQIYADILKRIHVASAYTASKNHRNHSVDRSYDRQQPKLNHLEDYIATMRSGSIENLFLHENNHLDRDVNTEPSSSPHMINECLVSSGFLKLHLFVLSFAVYFLPILLCCILQVRGKQACENTLAILKVRADLMSTLLRSNSNNGNIIVNEWLSTSGRSSGRQDSIDEFKASEIRDHPSSVTDVVTMDRNHERYMEAQNRDILLEVNCTARICGVVKVSLILCVLLWSPIFLGTLLRVFSCIHAPQWLTDTTYLSAIFFGIIRNILNINIIKIQELCNSDNTKENRIHPVE
ncbi:hypothetical protein EAI_11867 [Harpegnathos saltator]|uniref:Uncharacterized protein n=1 Tax=Harpegnathos saltator TaxID=610380 RepID=E2BTU0_HARSA|nr:hypothetical protein EAI_11867 [Harpegnathos saltator]